MSGTAIVILAAGASTRMGKSKQLLSWNDDTLLTHAVKTALQTQTSEVVVVLGANHQQHSALLAGMKVNIVVNHNWEMGMGSSLKAGLKYLNSSSKPDCLLVMVCDQPFVTSQHLDQLIQKVETSNGIVASGYAETAGVPAAFTSRFFEKILALDDSEGARKIIQSNKDLVTRINFPPGASDIDTPDQYEQSMKIS